MRGHSKINRAKSILVEGIKANNKSVTIDRIEESTLTSNGAVQTRNVSSRIPLIGLRFVVFDTWGVLNERYSGLQKIKIYGKPIRLNNLICASQQKKSMSMNILLYMILKH